MPGWCVFSFYPQCYSQRYIVKLPKFNFLYDRWQRQFQPDTSPDHESGAKPSTLSVGGQALLRPSQRPLCWPLWSGLIKERLSCVSFIHNRLRGEACIIMCQGSCQLEPSFCPGKMVSTSLLLAGRTDLDCPWYHSSQRSPLITRHSTVVEIIAGFCHLCTTVLVPKVPTRRAHQGTMTAIMRHLRTEVQPSFYQAHFYF